MRSRSRSICRTANSEDRKIGFATILLSNLQPAYLIALDVGLGVNAALPVSEVECAVHLDDGPRLGAVVAQVALERAVLRVHLQKKRSLACNIER